jgi:cytochrome b561
MSTRLPSEQTRGVYDLVTIRLHWATAGLVALLWIIGRTISWMPRGPLRVDAWSVHVLLGVALTGVVIARVFWRLHRGRTAIASHSGAVDIAASIVHFALYVLLIALLALGIMNVFAHGFAMFNLWKLPKVGDAGFEHTINEWHGLVANVLVALAALHSAAALGHHFVRKDGVLGRMIPGLATRAARRDRRSEGPHTFE